MADSDDSDSEEEEMSEDDESDDDDGSFLGLKKGGKNAKMAAAPVAKNQQQQQQQGKKKKDGNKSTQPKPQGQPQGQKAVPSTPIADSDSPSKKKRKRSKKNKKKDGNAANAETTPAAAPQQSKKTPQQQQPKPQTIPTTPKPAATPVKKQLPGGVMVEEVRVGQGPEASTGKMVRVNYVGRLKANNKQFDASESGPGFKFRLGQGEVIKGWDVGVAGMKVGGKRRILCPPGMAYGKKGAMPAIPPNSALVFDVELKAVN